VNAIDSSQILSHVFDACPYVDAGLLKMQLSAKLTILSRIWCENSLLRSFGFSRYNGRIFSKKYDNCKVKL
jgi:hypothetical protein